MQHIACRSKADSNKRNVLEKNGRGWRHTLTSIILLDRLNKACVCWEGNEHLSASYITWQKSIEWVWLWLLKMWFSPGQEPWIEIFKSAVQKSYSGIITLDFVVLTGDGKQILTDCVSQAQARIHIHIHTYIQTNRDNFKTCGGTKDAASVTVSS